jgi:polyphosphate kinase
MGRNMFRRIEIAWPVRDPALRQRVIDECLVPYLHDGATPGRWQPTAATRGRHDGPSAQQALMERYRRTGEAS